MNKLNCDDEQLEAMQRDFDNFAELIANNDILDTYMEKIELQYEQQLLIAEQNRCIRILKAVKRFFPTLYEMVMQEAIQEDPEFADALNLIDRAE